MRRMMRMMTIWGVTWNPCNSDASIYQNAIVSHRALTVISHIVEKSISSCTIRRPKCRIYGRMEQEIRIFHWKFSFIVEYLRRNQFSSCHFSSPIPPLAFNLFSANNPQAPANFYIYENSPRFNLNSNKSKGCVITEEQPFAYVTYGFGIICVYHVQMFFRGGGKQSAENTSRGLIFI